MNWIGLDIGGANLKLADARGFAIEVPFALWKHADRLDEAIANLVAEAPAAEGVAVTMTGELADCYASKREGVLAIASAVESAKTGKAVAYYCVDGLFRGFADLEQHYLLAAASNWHAAARFCTRFLPAGSGLYVDVGSTTTDIIPIVDGAIATPSETDVDRLLARELVYTGMTRTPVHAVVRSVPLRSGLRCPIAAEHFATTADVYCVLGMLSEHPTTDTADGKPLDRKHSLVRLARCVCGDLELLSESELVAMAQYIANRQQTMIRRAISTLTLRHGLSDAPAVVTGSGFTLAEACARTAEIAKTIPLASLIGGQAAVVTPALAVATLAEELIE